MIRNEKSADADKDDGFSSSTEPESIVYQLLPLTEPQIETFVRNSGIKEPDLFLKAVREADAMFFAERPQDLLDLTAYWKANKGTLGTHIEMLEMNIRNKLDETNSDIDKKRPLSSEDALSGAKRLAAAVSLQKKATIILPDKIVDPDRKAVSIYPKNILTDWDSTKISTLLSRAIFDGEIYGTVKFHHRTVREYLAARWFKRLMEKGLPFRSIELLIFNTQYGRNVVVPSMKPISAWLAVWDHRILDLVERYAPEVLIEHGDPSALPVETRKRLLESYADLNCKYKYIGTNLDASLITRFTHPELAPTINKLLAKYPKQTDICILLLKLIWRGKIAESSRKAYEFAVDREADVSVRIYSLRALSVAGLADQKASAIEKLLENIETLDSRIKGEICETFFPLDMSEDQFLEILKAEEPSEKFHDTALKRSVKHLGFEAIEDQTREKLLKGMHELLKKPSFSRNRRGKILGRYSWLIQPAIILAGVFFKRRHEICFEPAVSDLFEMYWGLKKYNMESFSKKVDAVIENALDWREYRVHLFWHSINNNYNNPQLLYDWNMIRYYTHGLLMADISNIEILFQSLSGCEDNIRQTVSLLGLFEIYNNNGKDLKLKERIKQSVKGKLGLEERLAKLLKPEAMSAETKKYLREERYHKKRHKAQKQKDLEGKLGRQKYFRDNPEYARNIINVEDGTIRDDANYLYDRLKEHLKDGYSKLGYGNWKDLIEEFGHEAANNFRDGCVEYWRGYDPFEGLEKRSVNSTNSLPKKFGLAGLAMESSDDPEWAKKISKDEARTAAHYSVCDLNGFPDWFFDLHREHTEITDEVIIKELRWEILETTDKNAHSKILSGLRYEHLEFAARYSSEIINLIESKESVQFNVIDDSVFILLNSDPDENTLSRIAALSENRFSLSDETGIKNFWLVVLFHVNGLRGMSILERHISQIKDETGKEEFMINFCAGFSGFGSSRFGKAKKDYEKTEILKHFLPLVYRFVSSEKDPFRHGVDKPDLRDKASNFRSSLLNKLAGTPGREPYDALVELSGILENQISSDYIEHLAKKRAEEDSEHESWSESQISEFAEHGMKTPENEKDLYDIALYRLDDIKRDIEDGDVSIAGLLKKQSFETDFRKYLEGRLKEKSRSLYVKAAEEQLADDNRTDIRLHSPHIGQAVPIELKLAEKWRYSELLESIENQLIGKYMRTSKYGIFLVIYNNENPSIKKPKKSWTNRAITPQKEMCFSEMIEALRADISLLFKKHPQINALEVVGIDLDVRFSSKNNKKEPSNL